MSALMDRLSRWVFPPLCLVCGGRGLRSLDICDACRADLPMIEQPCDRCGLPTGSADASTCARCLARAPAWDSLVCVGAYRSPLDSLVQRLKYGGRLEVAALLGSLLAERLRPPFPDLVVPVPLHHTRLRERGFNQALEIARPIGAMHGLTLRRAAVRRRRATPAQAGLTAPLRRRSLRGAFEATAEVRGCRVAVVDDVVTTGSTVVEITRALRAAGAVGVEVWCVARTLE